MTVKAADPEAVVAAAIKEISHIATLPEITVKIIELVEDPTSSAQDLHNVISNDPALCSRILKVVNSSFYGLPGQIGSINRAIVLLGLNAVKNIAISASLAKLFRGGQITPTFAARDLWVHSIATATACKFVADELKLGVPDEAFLAGLIHDIGIMVELQYDKNKLVEVLNKVKAGPDGAPTCDMLAAEREIYGADHQHFGRALCEKWKFPKAFFIVTGWHHTPTELPSGSRTLACIVNVAERIAASAKPAKAGKAPPNFRLDLASLEPDAAVLDEIKLTRERFEAVKERLANNIGDVETLLS